MGRRDIEVTYSDGKKDIIENTTMRLSSVIDRQTVEVKDYKSYRRIREIEGGTVFDHLYPGIEIDVDLRRLLGLKIDTLWLAQNEGSNRYGRKDFLKVENWYPTDRDIKKINEYFLSLPTEQQRLTLSIIKNSEVKEKYRFEAGKGLRRKF